MGRRYGGTCLIKVMADLQTLNSPTCVCVIMFTDRLFLSEVYFTVISTFRIYTEDNHV